MDLPLITRAAQHISFVCRHNVGSENRYIFYALLLCICKSLGEIILAGHLYRALCKAVLINDRWPQPTGVCIGSVSFSAEETLIKKMVGGFAW